VWSGVRLNALLRSSGSGGNKIVAMPSVGASADRTLRGTQAEFLAQMREAGRRALGGASR
jgi:hypothetical protein